MLSKTSTFKSFPEFSKLTMADKEEYERLITGFPPLTDISFQSLMIWWNFLDTCAVSQLNGNLIISYWMPGDELNSGLCFLGMKNVDESICTILDFLKDKSESPRLVHVPEFVVASMKYPDLFSFTAEQDYSEAIYAVSNIYPLRQAREYIRMKVGKFLAEVDETCVTIRTLDLRLQENQALLLDSSRKWFQKGNANDLAQIDKDALKIAICNADVLDVRNVCLYIEDRFVGFQLYHTPTDQRYVIATFQRVDCSIPGINEYMFYSYAKWCVENGFTLINYEQDLGLPKLRAEKLAFGPTNYFRKYTVEPAGGRAGSFN